MLLKLNSILDTRKIKVQNEPALTSRTFSSICDCDFVLSLTWPTELRDKRQIKGNALKSFPRAIYPQLAHGAVWLPQNYHSIQFNQCALRGLKINYWVRHSPCLQGAYNLELRFKSPWKENLLFSAWTTKQRWNTRGGCDCRYCRRARGTHHEDLEGKTHVVLPCHAQDVGQV